MTLTAVYEEKTLSEWKDAVKRLRPETLEVMLKRNEEEENFEVCAVVKNEIERRKVAEKF